MRKSTLLLTLSLLLIAVFAFSLTACDPATGTLESLQNEYGVTVNGGGFEEGSILVSDSIATTSEEAKEVLEAIADESYNKDGSVYIFDIYVTKDGEKVQPNGKVTVSVPVPGASVDNYLVFHVKDEGSVEKLVVAVADGKISFEVSSFSYFVIAQAPIQDAPPTHVHDFKWVEGKASTCTEEGIAPHYNCEGCGKNFNENKGEITSVALSLSAHEYGSMYWGRSANFWEDGNIEYYQCETCEGYFDVEYNEIDSPVIPKYATNLSICVNGVPTELAIDEQNDSFIAWSVEGLSVTKGDVITICQTDNREVVHNYFAEGNVGIDGKILTTAGAANVALTATPNGLMLFIDGYKYEGIVIEINGVQYPMIYTEYRDETPTYIYGYVNFAVGDQFVIVDNISGTVYDYDDLHEDYLWDTWDFHRGDNGEFVIDYVARYGIEFDDGGTKKIYVNKVFAPLDGSSYELNFENTDTESVELEQMQIPTGSEAYEDLMWYYDHEDTVNKEDIVSYIGEEGLYVYIVKLQLEEGTKFNIKNLTANSIINAEHLAEVYTESGSITKDGDYVKILKGGYYSIVYMPCFNSFMIEEMEAAADVYMYLDGEFVPLLKDAEGVVTYEGLAADASTNIIFTDNTYTNYLPITLDSNTDSTVAHVFVYGGMSMLYFDKAGTYDLAYNVETGILSITAIGGGEQGGGEQGGGSQPDSSVTYFYYLGVVDYTNGNKSELMDRDAANGSEYCERGITIAASSYVMVLVYGSDESEQTYYTLSDTDPSIASTVSTLIMISQSGTYDIYFNTETKTVRIEIAA